MKKSQTSKKKKKNGCEKFRGIVKYVLRFDEFVGA